MRLKTNKGKPPGARPSRRRPRPSAIGFTAAAWWRQDHYMAFAIDKGGSRRGDAVTKRG